MKNMLAHTGDLVSLCDYSSSSRFRERFLRSLTIAIASFWCLWSWFRYAWNWQVAVFRTGFVVYVWHCAWNWLFMCLLRSCWRNIWNWRCTHCPWWSSIWNLRWFKSVRRSGLWSLWSLQISMLVCFINKSDITCHWIHTVVGTWGISMFVVYS